METILLVGLVTLTGSIIQSSIGFGNAVFCMNFMPSLVPYPVAVGVTQVFSFFLNLAVFLRYRRHVDWRICLPQLIPSVFASLFFTKVALGIDASHMKIALGFLFVVLSIYFSFFSTRIRLKAGWGIGFADGIATGICNGFFGIGGPVTVLYFSSVISDKLAYMATCQLGFMVLNAISVVQRVEAGVFSKGDIGFLFAGVIGAVLGTFVGAKFVDKVNSAVLKRLVYLFIGVNGLIIVLPYLFS